MSTKDGIQITFDENGICSFCHEFDQKYRRLVRVGEEGRRALSDTFEIVKEAGRGKQYDLVMGVSGGVDSTYMALLLKQHGLRPLLIHFDNGWNSELAVKNIENICKRLDFELFTYVVHWPEFRDLQLSYFKAGVVDLEVPSDHAIQAIVMQMARKFNVTYLCSGQNVVTEGLMPNEWRWDKLDLLNLEDIHRKFGTVKLQTYPRLGFAKRIYYQFGQRIQTICPLDYVDYNKAQVKEEIARELGWRDYGGKHFESIFTRFYQAYILPRKFGIDKRKIHLSNLICAGQITRDQALHELSQPICDPETIERDRAFVMKKLGLTEKDFNAYMIAPVVPHSAYDSYSRKHYVYHQRFFSAIAPFRRLIRTLSMRDPSKEKVVS